MIKLSRKTLTISSIIVFLFAISSCSLFIDTFKVVYDGNGYTNGLLPVDEIAYQNGDVVTVLPKGTMARSGYSFVNWNTQQDGQGNTRESGDTFFMGSRDVVLYAQWIAEDNTPYTVKHYKQAVTGDEYILASEDTDYLSGTTESEVTAEANTYTGFTENTEHPNRVDTSTINGDGSLELKFFYDRETFAVSFEENGGSEVADLNEVRYGARISEPSNISREHFSLGGWYKDLEDSSTLWDFDENVVTQDLMLHADWDVNEDTVFFTLTERNAAGEPEVLEIAHTFGPDDNDPDFFNFLSEEAVNDKPLGFTLSHNEETLEYRFISSDFPIGLTKDGNFVPPDSGDYSYLTTGYMGEPIVSVEKDFNFRFESNQIRFFSNDEGNSAKAVIETLGDIGSYVKGAFYGALAVIEGTDKEYDISGAFNVMRALVKSEEE